MTIIRPVQRLVGNEARGRGVWHDEVDKLRALEADEAVRTGDDEHDRYRTDERPQPGWHADSVPHSSCIVRRFADSSRTRQNGAHATVTPNLMRTIDFWVGIPLTFFFTVVCRIQRFLGLAASPAGAPRNILFIQLAEMGTMVVAYPALRKARELFPDATLHFLCFTEIRPSVEMLEIIPSENILIIDAHSVWSLVRDSLLFPWRARRRRIDTVINTEAFVRYSSVLSYLSGARRRVGFHRFNQEGMYTGDLLTHKVLYNAQIHAAHTFLDLVHALEAPPDQVPRVKRPKAMDRLDVPKVVTDATAAAAIWRKLRAIAPDVGPTRKLVVINPNASARFPMRRLPLESFTELARQLLEDPEVFVLITGVASEKPDAAVHLLAGRIAACAGPHRPNDDDRAPAPVRSGTRAGHERLRTSTLRRVDTDPRHRLLRARDSRALPAAGDELGRRPHRILLQSLHRSVQSAAVALQRQPVSEEHQRSGDYRARSIAPRGGSVRDSCVSPERVMTTAGH